MQLQRILLLAAAAVATVSVAVDAKTDCATHAPHHGHRGHHTDAPVVEYTDAPSAVDASADGTDASEYTDNGSLYDTTDAPISEADSAASEPSDDDDNTDPSAVDDSDASAPASDSAANEADNDQGFSLGADSDASDVADSAASEATAPSVTDAPTVTEAPIATTATPKATTVAPTSAAITASNSTEAATTSSSSSKLCSKPRVVITEINVGNAYEASEDEAALKVLAIAAKPSGGSRVAYQSGDYVYVHELDASDKVTSTAAVKVPANDFADIYADDDGFVIMGTRDAEGGGTLNCGNPSNLCGTAPNPAVPCYDMYLIRYDGATESWATKLTSSSSSLPPYSTSATGPDVYMIWWYAHHGRIAFDGTNWASYFGAAISTSESSCINIHQGDRMKVVNPSGSILSDHNSFDWGCSHSGYERITYDKRSSQFATICKTDSNNRIMPPNNWDVTIYPVDLAASNLGDIVVDGSSSGGGYWATVSNGDGDNAAVHLIHFTLDAKADQDITLKGGKTNERAPHLASIGSGGMLAMWEGSSSGGDLAEGSSDRTIFIQTLDSTTGKAISDVVTVDSGVVGNRYQALKSYPDGSVAYLSKGSSSTSLQVVRIHGC